MTPTEDTIGVVGISTLDGLIGPNGNHLRWSFPRELGFPDGFNIYRKGPGKPKDSIPFAQLPLNEDLSEDLKIDGVELIVQPPSSKLRCRLEGTPGRRVLFITPANQAQLELRFPQPIATVQVRLRGPGSSAVKAYHNARLLDEVTVDTEPGQVSCAGITHVTIELGKRSISLIGYTTEADACEDTSWTLIQKLKYPKDDKEALSRFENGLKNYYVASQDDAEQHYKQGAEKIVRWLGRLFSPTAEFFEDPDAPPHQLKIRSTSEKHVSSATYLQSVLLLAALDPNIARMMSLYWVDLYEPSEHQVAEPPQKDRLYDYKVEGIWKDQGTRCGLLLNLGLAPAPQPSIPSSVQLAVVAEQLAGLRWVDGKPLGRVGLRWTRPSIAHSPGTRAVQPVLYELTRISGGSSHKFSEPVLVDNRAWKQKQGILYVDRDVPLGSHRYEVRPIDLFGQLGSAIASPPITVKDLEAPPPPIRTRLELSQSGLTADVRLQFEFGASQYQQAPDIKEFVVYWRPDTLLTRELIYADVTSTPDGAGKVLHRLRMRLAHLTHVPIPVQEVKTFVGDVLTNVIRATSQPLPAKQRRRYRIAGVDDSGIVVLEPTVTKMTSGIYELVRDPHNRQARRPTWTRLPQATVPWQKPIRGLLRKIDNDLSVEVVSKKTISPRPDPFALVPPEKRPREFPNLPPPKEVIEITINRLLTEPDLFAGGWINNSHEIIYAVSNAPTGQTHIALPAEDTAAVAEGDTVTLTPASAVKEKIRLLRISGAVEAARLSTPGGEIAFDHTVDGKSVTTIMRVISNAVNLTGAFDLVVRADSAEDLNMLQANGTEIHYYAPYVVTFPISLASDSNAPIALPLAPDQGSRDGFIAVSATDNGNHEGPLSAPAQFSVIRPQPSGAPSKPYPCGLGVTAEAGYATPPNRAGRATVCLAWEAGTLNPAEGARYEVARALDNTILAAHLRAWQMGQFKAPLALPILTGQRVEGSVGKVSLNSETGLMEATFLPDSPVADPAIFRNGRLETDVVYTEDEQTKSKVVFFQVTLAKSDGTKIQLLLRGPSEPLPNAGRATLEAPPNYSEAKKSVAALQNLALTVPDAFALVTGVPIEARSFTDDVAGKGRNAFFYRVRAVDAAENRSEWSPISAPFYQVDTSPPQIPSEVRAGSGIRSVTLRWLLDSSVHRYAIHRAASLAGLSSGVDREPLALVEATANEESPREVVFRDEPLDPLDHGGSYFYNVRAIRSLPNGPGDTDRVVVSSPPSKIVRATPVDPNPPVSPNDLIATRSLENGVAVVRLTWSTTVRHIFQVRRRPVSSTGWMALSGWLEGGDRREDTAGWHYSFVDNASAAEPLVYQVVLRNHAGRTASSNETDPI